MESRRLALIVLNLAMEDLQPNPCLFLEYFCMTCSRISTPYFRMSGGDVELIIFPCVYLHFTFMCILGAFRRELASDSFPKLRNPINTVFAQVSLRVPVYPLRRSSSLSRRKKKNNLSPRFYHSIVLERKWHSSRDSLVRGQGRAVLLHLLGFRSNLHLSVPAKVGL